MRTIMPSLALLGFLAIFAVPAQAQFQGPSSLDRQYTVSEIRDKATYLDRIDALVRVRGFIVSQQDYNTYLFEDATGMIRVEIDRKVLPDRPFNDKTEVILVGQVENDLLFRTEIEVERFRFAE